MIIVYASPDGDFFTEYNHPTATGWDNDDRGNLDITARNEVIATYRDGTWFRVWEGDTVTAPSEATSGQHGSPDA